MRSGCNKSTRINASTIAWIVKNRNDLWMGVLIFLLLIMLLGIPIIALATSGANPTISTVEMFSQVLVVRGLTEFNKSFLISPCPPHIQFASSLTTLPMNQYQ